MSEVLKIYDETQAVFHCPGCKYGHPFDLKRWTWNGSMEKPTFTPSLLVNGNVPDQRCHLFVTDGRIQFLDDCHHGLRGHIVDMQPWDTEDYP